MKCTVAASRGMIVDYLVYCIRLLKLKKSVLVQCTEKWRIRPSGIKLNKKRIYCARLLVLNRINL